MDGCHHLARIIELTSSGMRRLDGEPRDVEITFLRRDWSCSFRLRYSARGSVGIRFLRPSSDAVGPTQTDATVTRMELSTGSSGCVMQRRRIK